MRDGVAGAVTHPIILAALTTVALYGLVNAGRVGWHDVRRMHWQRRAVWLDGQLAELQAELAEMTDAAAYWQGQAGTNAEDAGRWRLHRACERRSGGATPASPNYPYLSHRTCAEVAEE